MMEDSERKKLVWKVKKDLFHLSAKELFHLVNDIPRTQNRDPTTLSQHDEESCIDYICNYMNSEDLLELEDEGMSQLMYLRDKII